MNKPVGQFCPLCGSEGKLWGIKLDVPLRACCNTLLAWAWDSVEHYEGQYETMDYHRDACIALGLPTQMDRFEEHRAADHCRIKWLSKRFKWNETRVLDVGSSNGAFVYAATYDFPCKLIEGLEPNGAMCDWVQKEHGTVIHEGGWNAIHNNWDIIVANDVIEHLTDPAGFFEKTAMHSDYLYLETPDWNQDRTIEWKHIKPKEHICLFSEGALAALAKRHRWNLQEAYRPIEGKLAVLFERSRKR